jgi:hypothetical protein
MFATLTLIILSIYLIFATITLIILRSMIIKLINLFKHLSLHYKLCFCPERKEIDLLLASNSEKINS